MKSSSLLAFALGCASVAPVSAHLLITEIRVTPSQGEFIEIHNPGGTSVPLDDIYISDATYANNSVYYYKTPTGDRALFGGGANNDFTARFPVGASIAGGAYVTVALSGSANFNSTYGKLPDYELFEDGDVNTITDVPDMREAASGSIHKGTATVVSGYSYVNGAGFTNGGEMVVLYSWDQNAASPVKDLDYVIWGNTTYGVSKNGVAGYNSETLLASQKFITPTHAATASWQRATLVETSEVATGGNGVDRHDEMSEDLDQSFVESVPTPGGAYVLVVIPDAGIKKISEIQGSGDASALVGNTVTTSGVIYADFRSAGKLKGFYVQDLSPDADPLTSEGLFVYCDACTQTFAVGDSVTLKGLVAEYNGLTELKEISTFTVHKNGFSVTPTVVTLPVADTTVWERYEGMLVEFSEALTVSETYQLGRYGQILLSQGGRLVQPTQVLDPNVAAVQAANLAAKLRSIVVDDASSLENPSPSPWFAAGETLRLGTKLNVKGALNYRSDAYRVEPVAWTVVELAIRPNVPTTVDATNLAVATFNMLNYFTTLNANGAKLANGLEPRGANTASELARQQAKLVAAVQAMNADILSLEEVENSGDAAVATFVQAVNAAMGADTYAYVKDPAVMGTDAIKMAMIYKLSAVTPVGRAKIVNASGFGRPSLVQTFRLKSNGALLTVIANHLKSKGCATGMLASDPESDQNDGQGCYNATRVKQAKVLADFVTQFKKQSGQAHVLLLGDFNSYAKEDPMDTLRSRGLTVLNENDTSYVYNGMVGQLDYAIATSELVPYVKLAKAWQINSAEPSLNDYDETFNPAAYYTADPFRSSDHDPVLVRLNLPANTDVFGLTLLHNNDAESFLLNPAVGKENYGGVHRFKSVLDSARARNSAAGHQVLTISSADNFIPGPELDASLKRTAGEKLYDSEVFNAFAYDVSALGNHDFDMGPDFLARFITETANVPFISANLDFSEEPSLQALRASNRIAPLVVLERGGEKIALIGATTPDLKQLANTGKVKILANLKSVIQPLVDSLENAGVNKIILISHLQAIANDSLLAKELHGVDVIIAGGGHENLANNGDSLVAGDKAVLPYPLVIGNSQGKPTAIVTTAAAYKYVGELNLEFDANGDLLYFGGAPLRVAAKPLFGGVDPNAALVSGVVDPVNAHLATLEADLVATTAVPLSGVRTLVRTQETNLGNLIADAHLWQAREVASQFGITALPRIAIQNGGGIRNNDVVTGSITRLRTFKILPFSNFLAVNEAVSPAELKDIMEHTVSAVEISDGRFPQIAGFRIAYNPSGQARKATNGVVTQTGERIRTITLDDGTAIVKDGEIVEGAPNVSLATIDFLAKGGDGFPLDMNKVQLLGTNTYQKSLENYLRHLGTVTAAKYPEGGEGRIRRVPKVKAAIAPLVVDEDFTPARSIVLADHFVGDVATDVLTYSATSSAAGLKVKVQANSTLEITADADFHGDVQVTVTAADVFGAYVSQTFVVQVNPVDDAVRTTDKTLPNISMPYGFTGLALDLTGFFVDPEGKELTYTLSASNDKVVIDHQTISSAVGASGDVLVTVEAGDGTTGNHASIQFTISIAEPVHNLVNSMNGNVNIVLYHRSLVLSQPIGMNSQIMVSDLQGVLHAQRVVQGQSRIDLATLPAGFYRVRVRDAQGNVLQRAIELR